MVFALAAILPTLGLMALVLMNGSPISDMKERHPGTSTLEHLVLLSVVCFVVAGIPSLIVFGIVAIASPKK